MKARTSITNMYWSKRALFCKNIKISKYQNKITFFSDFVPSKNPSKNPQPALTRTPGNPYARPLQVTKPLPIPNHRGDRFFEGNTILVQQTDTPTDPYKPFLAYLEAWDTQFPLNPELWLMLKGHVPTRHWFMSRLCQFFPKEIAGHSMWSGGATSLAVAGADLAMIQAVGRWSSDAFQIYIRKNPVLIHTVLFGHPAHQPLNWLFSPSLLFLFIFLSYRSIAPLIHPISWSTFFLSLLFLLLL